MIGPPMGLLLYLIASIAKISLRQLLVALLPFYIPLFSPLAIIMLVSDLVLWLPNMLR
ncbi:TRAP transporter large permease subunit [Halomonas cupida]|uniref:TRAP transporter large permease subunit n=1 Tax=Halomonas cupida TaxID=44933 RepID=UPI003A92168D